MKRLLFEDHNGCRYDSNSYYYTFDTEQEYLEFAEQLKPKQNTAFDVKIECEPKTIVSDGYATRGGRHLKAMGCKEWSIGRFCSYFYYYINPATIERLEEAKTESWWA